MTFSLSLGARQVESRFRNALLVCIELSLLFFFLYSTIARFPLVLLYVEELLLSLVYLCGTCFSVKANETIASFMDFGKILVATQ